MTYEELYRFVFEENTRDENDTVLEHLARTIYEKNFDGITTAETAVYRALELLPEMIGKDVDPTSSEFSDIVFNVKNPNPVRVRRGCLKAMRDGKLFDFISREYMAFRKEELAHIIMEMDYAAEQQDHSRDKSDYREMLRNAAIELEERDF